MVELQGKQQAESVQDDTKNSVLTRQDHPSWIVFTPSLAQALKGCRDSPNTPGVILSLLPSKKRDKIYPAMHLK